MQSVASTEFMNKGDAESKMRVLAFCGHQTRAGRFFLVNAKSKFKPCRIFLGLLVALLLWPTFAVAQETGYVQKTENGQIDWLTGEITAKGIGAPPAHAQNAAQARAMALRAATVIARRNLLELLEGVQIDSATTVKNFMVNDDTVVSRVQGHLQQARITDTAYMSDGSVEVTVQVNMRGRIAQVVLPQPAPVAMAPTPAPPTQEPGPSVLAPASPPPAPSRPAIPDGSQVAVASFGKHTGLVVDARGLGVRPAMSPRILDEEGREVYGSSFVGREYAIQQGMAGYAKSPEQAAQSDRVAGNPLRIKAKDVSGQAKTDIVVSNADAERIRSLASKGGVLEQCRVMIVLD